jgi:chromosome partitioning protein
MKPSSRLHAYAAVQDSPPERAPLTVSFVSQKGGVGKSTLARLFAVGAAHRGLKPLLADFDLEQLTCVEWNAIRLQNAVEPDIDARAFKSLKKLRKLEDRAGVVVVDTRGLADDLAHEVAEDSDVVFLPTGASHDDLRPTLALARKLAKHGAEGRLVVVLSKIGRSEPQLQRAVEAIETAGFELLPERWPQRDGFQSDLDSGRAGREARNPYLREAAEKMEAALFARAERARPR